MGALPDFFAGIKSSAETGAEMYGSASRPAPADVVKGVLGFTPILGDAISGYDAYDAAKNGNYGEAALNAVGVLPFVPSLVGSVSKPDGTSRIAQMLTELYKGKAAESVGTLEKNHITTWGKTLADDVLRFGSDDVSHTLKRIGEGLTPEEIADIGFRATQKNAHAQVTSKGDLILTSPIPMKFSDSPLFKPQAVIRERDDGAHLYGVVPKGWQGRAK